MTIFRVRTSWSGSDSAGSLSTHYFGTTSGTPSVADIQACIDRIRDFWTALNGHIATGVNWSVGGIVDHIDAVNGDLVGSTSAVTRTGTGTLSGDPLPAQTQGLIQWTTAAIVDSHRLRGHTYVPAPIETDSTGGAPVAAYVTALGTAVAAALVTGTYTLGVWHRPVFSPPGTLVRNGEWDSCTGGVGKGTWAVLRSRR
jgi:hypothetical protein